MLLGENVRWQSLEVLVYETRAKYREMYHTPRIVASGSPEYHGRMDEKNVVMFYGETCPYCQAIIPVVERLEREDGIAVERLEVWHNPENEKRMEALRYLYDEVCEGNMVVPSFHDPRTNRLLCNPGSYERLKEWLEQG